LANIPSLLYLLIIYNVVVFSGIDLSTPLINKMGLISGAEFTLTWSDLLVALGVVALYIEVFKATRTSTSSIIEHTFSMVLFIVYLVELIVVQAAGTSTFFILTLMQMLDVTAGFTITISTARRDLGMGGMH
jgi:hypothetical protein